MFTSPILQLLHREALKYPSNDSDTESSDDESSVYDYSDTDSSSDHEGTTHSNASGHANGSHGTHGTHGTHGSGTNGHIGLSSPIDNTSKQTNSIDQVNVSESDEDYTTEDSLDDEINYFFHIAFTPQECTVMCDSTIMGSIFAEPLKTCKQLGNSQVKLLDDEFITLQVDSSDGYDNSSKVLLLTKPLSTNNIPLFFLSTHFGDIVLIPESSKEKVVDILTLKNFEFSNLSNSYINVQNQGSNTIETGRLDGGASPNLDIEQRAFELFQQANVSPIINKSTKLLLTGARSSEASRTLLKTAQILASTDIQSEFFPQYFAITRTSLNEVSLLLPKSSELRGRLGFPSKCIIGSTQDAIIPITIDLHALPLDTTGIVAGLASKLLSGSKKKSQIPLEMSYLSMAKAGIVMIPKEDVELVSNILKEDLTRQLVDPIDSLRLE